MQYISPFLVLTLFCVSIYGTSSEDFITGNKIFTALVYKEISKTNNENILVSPFSAEIVLALTQSGANGRTGEEIRTSLHLPHTKEATESAIKSLLPMIKSDEHVSLQIANKIYVRQGLTIKENFKNIATNTFHSDIDNINFNGKAAKTINKWVEEHTNNKIHDLIDPTSIDESTCAILVNALHFKSNWLNPFSNLVTTTQKFYKTSQDTVQVKTMFRHEKIHKYYEDTELDAKFLEIPFENPNASMIIVLPNQIEGVKILENQIGKVFTERQLKNEYVNVEIPKFKIEKDIDFVQILQHFGVNKAFSPVDADFSGIAGAKGQLYIDSVKQKTFIDVNEMGVEAAAATFVEMSLTSALSRNPKHFKADHPFIFYIKYHNIILFAGRVSEPSE